jgi:hypothetical protein
VSVHKPKWVSFCGWAFVACLGFGAAVPLAKVLVHAPEPSSLFAGLVTLLSVPLLLLWILGTLVHRARARGAEMQAAAMMAAARKADIASGSPYPRQVAGGSGANPMGRG